jgi:hypothetical protein
VGMMKIICRPMRYGKTREMIILASKEKHGLIVCRSKDEAARIFRMAIEMEKNKEIENSISMPITYDDLLEKRYYGKHIDGIFIDNADAFLQHLIPIRIKAISLTTTEKSFNPNIKHKWVKYDGGYYCENCGDIILFRGFDELPDDSFVGE